jgi:hypothetical protein
VRIHRDKALKALEIMASGGTIREAQRATGLSFTQLKELGRLCRYTSRLRSLRRSF